MIRMLSVVVALVAFLLPANADSSKLDYVEKTLPNGLRVITLEDFSCPIVAVQVWYHVGSKDEDPNRQGFAHMFEHMMFRGTDRLGPKSHFDLIRNTGGDCNAYTSFDNTTYVNKLPSNQLELALWLESERMAFLKIDDESFSTERAVVEEERRLGLNAPYGTVLEKVFKNIFTKHPYQWTPIGQIPHLRKATIDELSRFWETYYTPNNATLVIVGAVKNDDAQALAAKYFGWIPAGDPPPRVTEMEPPQTQARELSISEPKGPVTIVGLAYRTVPEREPDYPTLQVLMQILGGGESSRLNQELVKKQELAVAALGGAFSLEMDGLAGVGGVLKPFGDKDKLLAALHKQLDEVKANGVTSDELEKAKIELLKGQVASLQTIAGKAQLIGQYAVLYNDLPRVNRRFDEIRGVTLEQVKAAANKYLVDERQTTIIVEPSMGEMLKNLLSRTKDESEGTPATKPTQNRVAERKGPKAHAVRPDGFPTTAPVAPLDPSFPVAKTEEKILPNGLKVVVIPNGELPLVTMSLGLKFGAWTDAKNAHGAASMSAQMITEGTKNYSSSELATELEKNAISLGASVGSDVGSVSANCLSDKSERAMELLAEVVRRPTFPEKDFNQKRDQALSGLSVSEQNPGYLADREFAKRVYNDHPYARVSSGESADIKALKTTDLANWWTTYVRPDTSVLYIAGDISADKAFALAEKSFGDWTTAGPPPAPDKPYLPLPGKTQIYLVDKPGTVQSEIRVGQLGITRDDPMFAVSRVLTQVFGGSFTSRLNESLRVKKGLTYGVGGGFSAQRFAGAMEISTFSKTPSTADAVKAIMEEIENLQRVPASDTELSSSKSFLVGSFAGQRETPQATIGDLWLIEYCGLPKDYLQLSLAGIGKTTSDDVTRLATEKVDVSKMVIVVVGDAKRIRADLEKIAPVVDVKAGEPATKPSN